MTSTRFFPQIMEIGNLAQEAPSNFMCFGRDKQNHEKNQTIYIKTSIILNWFLNWSNNLYAPRVQLN